MVSPEWRKSSRSQNGQNCVELRWRRSSSSQNGQDCVELLNTFEEIRDSKNPGPTLRADVRALTNWLRRP